jgi:PKD repeat protein
MRPGLMRSLVTDHAAAAAAVSAPVTDFTGTPLSIDAGNPDTCQFTDASTNTPTSRLWESQLLSGGWSTFSTSQNPLVTAGAGNFAGLGTYDIRLTSTNAGGSNTKTRLAYLTVTSGG